MGLDMYLSYSTPIEVNKMLGRGADFRTEPAPVAKTIIDAIGLGDLTTPVFGLLYVNVPAAYWRKANAIHKWFVENCQGGVDECQEADVSIEQLEELVALCKQAVHGKDVAETTLPTTEGFFFGGTEYDEWYFDGLKETIEQLEPWIAHAKKDAEERGWLSGSFTYRSSW